MARKIEVQITGDSRGLKAAFDDSSRAAQGFNQKLKGTTAELRQIGRTGGARYWRQVAAGAAGGGAAAFGLSRALQGAAEASKQLSGEQSRLTQSLAATSAEFSALVTLDVAGFIEQIGNRFRQTKADADAFAESVSTTEGQQKKLAKAAEFASQGFEDEAAALRASVAAAQLATAATDALEFSTRKMNTTLIDGTRYLIEFKGAVDDLGRGPRVTEVVPNLPTGRPFAGLSPEQRTDLSLIGVEGPARIPGLLRDIADEQRKLNNLRAAGLLTSEKHAEILTYIATIEAEIKGINQAQAAARKAAADAAREAAAAAAREAAERARRAREAARAAEQARQLAVLQRPIPTPANLARQLEQLQGRIAGGEAMPKWIRDILARIPDELKKNITPKTREAIRDFFQMVRGEFDKADDELLRRFPNAAINTNRLAAGLGLDPDQLRRLRMRLAGATGAGRMGRGTGAYGIPLAGNRAIETTVVLDGQVVGRSVKRFTSNDRIHSPSQKRGPHAGR